MKKLLAMLLTVAMVLSMIPVIASAETTATATPQITKVNMTLNGILNVNFKVDANGASMSGYSVNVTIGNDTTGQEITNYTMDGSLYVYTAKLPAHRLSETLYVTLLNGGTAVGETKEWTVASYLDNLEGNSSATEELKALCAKLEDYGTYAAAYDDGLAEEDLPDVADSELDIYKHNVTKLDANLKPVAGLYIDDACDLLVKFNAAAFAGKKLVVDTVDVTEKVETVGEQAVYRIEELLPQQWKHMYDIQVVDGENTVCHFTYGVMSYIRGQLSKNTEAKTGLKNLLKSMYAYSTAAIAYADQEMPDSVISYDPVTEVYTVKGTSDGAQDGFYYDIVSAEPSMRFEIVAEMTADQGDYTTGMGFVLEQNGNRVIFTYPTAWDIGVVVQNGTTGEIDTGKERFENYESLAFPLKGGNADYPIFTAANTLYKLKLVYDYGYIYFMYWNGIQWVQLPQDAYFASLMSRDADSLNGDGVVVRESIGVTFDPQQGFTVGVGTLLGQDHKGERTVGGTIANVQYTDYSTGEDVNIEYTNTLDEIYIRDSYILKDNGTYYLYGTTNFPTFQVWSSTDKVNWKTEGTCYFSAPDDAYFNVNTPEEPTTWAPEVYKVDVDSDGVKEYVMFATFTQNNNDYMQASAVLVSDTPAGTYTLWSEGPITPADHSCLDATLYYDGTTPYMIYSHEGGCSCGDSGHGTMMYVQLTSDLKGMAGTPVKWFSCDEWTNVSTWESFWGASDADVMDAPFVYTDANSQKWILWSTFLDGVYLQQATPFSDLGDTSSLEDDTITLMNDAGHGMILKDGDQDILVLHAPNSSGSRAQLLPVTLSNGKLSVWDGQFAGIAQERTQTYQANVTENTTLFVGDSFMDPAWWTNFSNDLLGKDALLLGIGSTASEDWYNYYLLDYFQKTDVQPKNIVFSIGNNDIHSDGLSAEVYVASMKSMLSEVNKRQPNSKLYIFSVAYRTNASTNSVVDTANTLLKAWCGETDGIVTFVDITATLGTDQFKDGVHPNNECYTGIYLPTLIKAGCEIVEMTPAGSTDEYGDKLLGGWLGQMLGVDRGYLNEFNNNATLVDDADIMAMSEVNPNSALYQDDLYVEIPFLQAMSQYGYNCNGSYLAEAFKNTTFGLWHANLWGRTNLQNGIEYPNSGSYLYNQCAEDIDWQIESDFLGMMYPGQPSAAAARAFELGHIMNYGDGVYGGVFVAAMHAQAYTAASLEEIWTAGIQVIPEGTQFRSLLEDVIANYNNGMSFENNWAAINAKWIPTAMCFAERNSCTIDAKLNAGYVLMALLYASTEGGIYNQIDKATYYAIKCGMDTDCNASTAASVLGNYYGYEAMQEVFNYSLSWNSKFSETSVTLTEATEMNIALMNAVLADNSTTETTITPVAVEQVPNGVYVYLNSMSEPSGKTVYFNGATFRYKNAEAVSYTVDYGDGTVREASDYWLVYTYAEEGTYTIKFTVHDSLGGSHTATLTVCAGFSTEGATTITSLSQITDSSGSYVLGADITNDKTTLSEFSGTLNGNGHTITTSVPLFEALNGATVENLKIKLTGNMTAQGTLASSAANAAITSVTVIGNGYTLTGSENAPVGGLVGTAQYTTFTDCSSSVNVTAVGTGSAGGILGATSADEILLCRCSNEGTVTAADASAGGILGDAKSNKVKLYGCTNSGTVSTSGDYKGAGGIVGEAYWASGTADSVYIGNAGNTVTTNIGTVSGYYAGGIVGYAHDGAYLTVENAVNKGTVTDGSRTAQDTRVGGIVGFANHNNSVVKLNNCSNEGTISGGIVGGILGHGADTTVTITGGSNSGLVTGEEYLGTGGIVGRVDGSAANMTVTGVTNSGTVRGYSNSDWRIGGIIGYHAGNATAKIDGCTNTGTIYGTIIGGMVGQSEDAYLTVTNSTSEGPIAGMNNRFAAGIVGLANGGVGSATITGNTITAYITNTGDAAWQIGNIMVATNTVSGNTESGTVFQNCAGATEITDWSQITDMYGTYILAADITTNGTTYDFHGRLYGAGHTIYTATTLFGSTNNAQFSVQDLNVVLTANLEAEAVLINEITAYHDTVKVTIKNVNVSANEGVTLTISSNNMNGALAGSYNTAGTKFINCTDTVNKEQTGQNEITCQADLEALASQGGTYEVTEDFALDSNFTSVSGFTGTLNGNGHIITTATTLFDTLEGATVQDLNIALSGNVSGSGALVNTASAATITDVHVSGDYTVSGTSYTGGLIGVAKNGTVITDCSNAASVTGTGDSVGGIVGMTTEGQVTVNSSTNSGIVSGYRAGGIVGMTYDKLILTGAKNTGTISDGDRGSADTRIGGILGHANSQYAIVEMTNCVNEGAISGGIVGGILGHAAEATVTITGGSNSGLITAEDYLGAGGIVGRVDGSAANVTISGATNKGTVRGYNNSDWRIGGIIGYHTGNATAKIDGCTNSGTIYGTIIGGMVGQSENAYLTVTNSTSEGPIAGMNNRFAGGIVGLANGDVGSATITGNTITAYITNTGTSAWQIGNISVSTNTVSGNTESGTVFQNCAGATEITDWSQITDMYGTYILASDITVSATYSSNFQGRLYGAGHTIYTSATLFDSTSNAQFSVQDLNVVLTANLTARSIIINEQYAAHETVAVTFRNVHTSAKNGAVFTGTGDSTGALAGECAHTHFINCSNSVPIASGDSARVGGLVGWTKMGYCVNFTNCSNSGSITGSVTGDLGGIVGQAHADSHNFTKCSNSGSITAAQYSNGVGGIVGYLPCQATFANCSNTGSIYINGDDPGEGAGGILGRIDNVYSTASTTITNCTNSGTVRAKYAGGIVGLALDGPTVNISNCKNSGAITGTTVTGGIIGLIRGITLTLDENTCTPGDDYSYIGGQW